jgi:hypothetical protein
MHNLRYVSFLINKQELSKKVFLFLLFSILVLYFFISTKILWILYLLFLFLFVFSRMKVIFRPLIIILILSLPLIWGLIMSYDSDLYHISQGFFYLSIPLLLILIGFQLSKVISANQFFSFIVVTGTMISLFYIIIALQRFGIKAIISPYTTTRIEIGSGSPTSILSMIVCLFSKGFDLHLFKKKSVRILSILTSLVAIYLYASRTYWIMVLIFLFIFAIRIMKNDKLIIFSGIVLMIFILLLNTVNFGRGLSQSNSLLYKLFHSYNEIIPSNFKNFHDINANFRGYESYRSWQTYIEGKPLELVFGGGLGKLIDLNTKIFLVDKIWREVPVVHNGLFFILVKTGALGLIFNLFFFFLIMLVGFRKYRSKNLKQQFMAVFLICCGISLFLANVVVCGEFNFEMSLLIITIGYIIQIQFPYQKYFAPLSTLITPNK